MVPPTQTAGWVLRSSRSTTAAISRRPAPRTSDGESRSAERGASATPPAQRDGAFGQRCMASEARRRSGPGAPATQTKYSQVISAKGGSRKVKDHAM